MDTKQRDFIMDCIFEIFEHNGSLTQEEFNKAKKEMLGYDYPKDVRDIQILLKYTFGNNFFVDRKTQNTNAASTIAIKIAHNFVFEVGEYDTMEAKQYIQSSHFAKLTFDKLEQQPLCESCGNKATKIFLKTWNKKGCEELDDVWSICQSCKVIDGQLVAKRDLKQLIKEEIENDANLKSFIKECAEEIIKSQAIRMLNDKTI